MRRVVKLVKAAVDTVGSGVGDIDPEVSVWMSVHGMLLCRLCVLMRSCLAFQDDMGFIRIRTKKYEMMISPSECADRWCYGYQNANHPLNHSR